MKRLPLMPALLLLAACAQQPFDLNSSALLIRSETAFGMCLGYCRTELVIDSALATLTVRSQGPDPAPPKVFTLALSRQEWQNIINAVDGEGFSRLDDVYGCPDCADGGLEAVELNWGANSKRVRFEYRTPPQALRALHDRIWQIRNRFPS